MNRWGTPDWRDANAYGEMSTWTFEKWRWEFMRRQPDLRAYFDERAVAARKARCESADIPKCNPNFLAEMTCAIDDPRFTLLEDPACKSRFGYLRLHNPRISGILPSQFLAEPDDSTVIIADPGLMQRTLKLEDWQIGIAFDLTKPIEPQLAAALSYLKHVEAEVRNDNVIARFRLESWPLDSRLRMGRARSST